MNKDWLINRINEEAEQCFEKDFESLTTDDSGANQLFTKVKQTAEWSAFKAKMIELYKKQIERNLFYKLEGLEELVKDAGNIKKSHPLGMA